MRKKKKARGNIPLGFKLYYKAYSNQNSMMLDPKQTHKSMEGNREPRNKPIFIWLIVNNARGGKMLEVQWRKDSLLNKWCWEDWTVICKRVNPDYFLTSFTKINSKWIKDLNLRLETIKLLEENIGSVHFDISLSNMFCICLLRQRETKAKINR